MSEELLDRVAKAIYYSIYAGPVFEKAANQKDYYKMADAAIMEQNRYWEEIADKEVK